MTIKALFPSSEPAIELDFANTKALDPRITFTRVMTGASVATYVGADGLIKTAGNNVPRFDHNPVTGESLGLLVEDARTNTLRQSQGIGASPWGVTELVVTQNAAVAPDGTSTATSLVATSANSNHIVSMGSGGNSSTPTNEQYRFSCYFKFNGHRYVGFHCNINAGTYGHFDLVNGTAAVGFIESVGNGWYRCISDQYPAGAGNIANTLSIALGTSNAGFSGAGIAFVGDGVSSALAWGAQSEAGTWPTSYIPTTTATVTRAADVATVSNANSRIFPTSSFTTINSPFGTAGGGSTIKLVGPTIKRTAIYSSDLPQAQINALTGTGDFWRWRVLGSTFALPSFTTDGSVTVDWGDGTVQTLTTGVYTFTNGGGYHDIGFRLNSGTFFKPNINNNATYKTRVIATGPAPASMKFDAVNAFFGCTALKLFDAKVDVTGRTDFLGGWSDCQSLISFPLIDTSAGTSFIDTWYNCSSLNFFPLINTTAGTNFTFAWYGCSSLTSFPLINTAAATNLTRAWQNCPGLTSFPLITTTSVTNFYFTWAGCTGLTSFPLINTGAGTNFSYAWYNCSSLTSFPLINTAAGTNFSAAWLGCSSLTSFPLINTAAGTNFLDAWQGCSSLTSFPLVNIAASTQFGYAWVNCTNLANFPANFFDAWTATPVNGCFYRTWDGCASLTPASVVNILDSIALSGRSAPGGVGPSDREITIDWNGTGTPAVTSAAAITTLKSRNWTIFLNGVLQ